jgi:hypothetical protein
MKWVRAAAVAAVFLAGPIAWLFLREPAPPAPSGTVSGRARARTPAATLPSAPRRPHSATSTTEPPASDRGAAGGFTVEADVPGADVFVDRVFKGHAPLTIADLAPGPHRLNVSAEGEEGYADTVEVTGAAQTVAVRLKAVHLDAAVDVVHKHALGSCQGRLSATPGGLRYQASKGDDSFEVPLASVERIATDYMKKTLTVKLGGGRTYNFTPEGDSADPLLSFQQSVSKAQARRAAAP